MLKIFEALINQFNTERKCGHGWKFYATGRQDYSNLIDTDADCEDVIFIFETWTEGELANRNNGEKSKSFTLDCFIGFQSDLSESFYNESGECSDNRYEKYIEPLEDCLDNSGIIDMICVHNDWYLITSITRTVRLNYLDQNLDGFKLRLIYSS